MDLHSGHALNSGTTNSTVRLHRDKVQPIVLFSNSPMQRMSCSEIEYES